MRGLNPIVAAILLMLLAIAISASVYVWVTGINVSLRETIFGSWSETQKQEDAKLALENLYASGDDLILVVKNSGSYDFSRDDLRKLAVYFDDVAVKMYYNRETHQPPNECGLTAQLLKTGNTILINCTTSYLNSGRKTEVRIAMPFGQGDSRSFTLPK